MERCRFRWPRTMAPFGGSKGRRANSRPPGRMMGVQDQQFDRSAIFWSAQAAIRAQRAIEHLFRPSAFERYNSASAEASAAAMAMWLPASRQEAPTLTLSRPRAEPAWGSCRRSTAYQTDSYAY